MQWDKALAEYTVLLLWDSPDTLHSYHSPSSSPEAAEAGKDNITLHFQG